MTREVHKEYRGRLAPSPTGWMHLGHAKTFWRAQERARAVGGTLILRNDDLDGARVRPEFVSAFIEDLQWLGCRWDEGPDIGGKYGPYSQSQRLPLYRAAFELLRDRGLVYPCVCSRRDILTALTAPHAGEEEPIYPGTCRAQSFQPTHLSGRSISWRLRVEPGTRIRFHDGHFGPQEFVVGVDFGEFVVWRPDDLPSYQLACVVDDSAMRITEVVRGEDLLMSTARQLLLYQALGLKAPSFYHCPLVRDTAGKRLAKRHDALSLRVLREQGHLPEALLNTAT